MSCVAEGRSRSADTGTDWRSGPGNSSGAVSECIWEQIVDIPAPHIWRGNCEGDGVPQERIHEYTAEETIDAPVPQGEDDRSRAAPSTGPTQNRTLDVPMPQIQEQTVEVIQFISQERISERIVEHAVDVFCTQSRERSVEVVKVINHDV